MRAGAWGMSTGLIYVPSSYADTNELIAIAKVVAGHGGIYVSHIRNENVRLLAAVDEAMKIGREAGLPVHISHFKSSGRDAWGLVRRAAEMIEAARGNGHRVTARSVSVHRVQHVARRNADSHVGPSRRAVQN